MTLTETPYPFPVSTPGPAREILLEFGSTGGDGGTSYDFFLGSDVPSLVLYTDGLLIISERQAHDRMSFLHKQLTDIEMCDLLQAFSATGLFEASGTGQSYPDDPIYKSNDYYGDGASGYIIEINGPRSKFVWIYRPAIDNLVPQVAAAYQLATSYTPSGLQPFDSHRVIVAIERMPGEDWLGPTPGPRAPWPSDLPPLGALMTDPMYRGADLFTGDEADLLRTMMPLPGAAYFTQDDETYFVFGRPALPHETGIYFSQYPWHSTALDLPFACDY
jgi:hypothetical protein